MIDDDGWLFDAAFASGATPQPASGHVRNLYLRGTHEVPGRSAVVATAGTVGLWWMPPRGRHRPSRCRDAFGANWNPSASAREVAETEPPRPLPLGGGGLSALASLRA